MHHAPGCFTVVTFSAINAVLAMTISAHVDRLNGCRNCGDRAVAPFLELPNLPITGAFLRRPEEKEFQYPMTLFVCPSCGTVQSQHNISFSDYYDEYAYTLDTSAFANTFAKTLAEQVVERYALKPGSRVLEIGSGDGTQLGYFKALGMDVLGFEPSSVLSKVANDNGIQTIKALYSLETSQHIPRRDRRFQLVLLTHVLDHLPSQKEFLTSLMPILDPADGLLLIEVHDFEQTFIHKEYCLFQHEHTVYPTAATLQRMFQAFGLCVIDVGVLPEEVKRAHSLMVLATPLTSRYAAQKMAPLPLGPMGDRDKLQVFGKEVERTIANVRQYILSRREQGKSLAAFGAGGRGIMTLAAAARPGEIDYICDSSEAHRGLYTPAAHIEIVAPSMADERPVSEVLVCSYGYIDEIRRQLSGHSSRGGRITSLLDVLDRGARA